MNRSTSRIEYMFPNFNLPRDKDIGDILALMGSQFPGLVTVSQVTDGDPILRATRILAHFDLRVANLLVKNSKFGKGRRKSSV